jgi:hypothetical protein
VLNKRRPSSSFEGRCLFWDRVCIPKGSHHSHSSSLRPYAHEIWLIHQLKLVEQGPHFACDVKISQNKLLLSNDKDGLHWIHPWTAISFKKVISYTLLRRLLDEDWSFACFYNQAHMVKCWSWELALSDLQKPKREYFNVEEIVRQLQIWYIVILRC